MIISAFFFFFWLLLKSSWLTVLSLYFLRLPFPYGFFSLSLFSFRLMSGTCSSSVTSYNLLHSLLMSHVSTHICTYGGGGLVTKSCLTLSTPCSVAYQDPPSLGFPRQEYWSGLPFPSPGDLPNPGSPNLGSCIAGRFFTKWATKEAPSVCINYTHKLSSLSGSSNSCEEPDY